MGAGRMAGTIDDEGLESHRQNGARVALPLARRDFWMHAH